MSQGGQVNVFRRVKMVFRMVRTIIRIVRTVLRIVRMVLRCRIKVKNVLRIVKMVIMKVRKVVIMVKIVKWFDIVELGWLSVESKWCYVGRSRVRIDNIVIGLVRLIINRVRIEVRNVSIVNIRVCRSPLFVENIFAKCFIW